MRLVQRNSARGLRLATLLLAAAIAHPVQAEHPDRYAMALIDKLEWRDADGPNELHWDSEGWWGSDEHKLVWRFEGEEALGGSAGETETQLLYNRLIAPFWDLQVGLRYDRSFGPGPHDDGFHAVAGIVGEAPYRLETEALLFLSEEGDLALGLEVERDLYLTRRWVVQPRLGLSVATGQDEEFGAGDGLREVELDLRLRYEFRPGMGPYVGVSWGRSFGDTADFALADGERRSHLAWVAGLRWWF